MTDDLRTALGDIPVKFWACPEHFGSPHRVEWHDGVAHCLTEPCWRTSVPPRLTVELVPRTSFYNNVRTRVTANEWGRCKAYVRERSNDRCEICGGQGNRWPVECHEIWTYEEEYYNIHQADQYPPVDTVLVGGTQRLAGLIALCPRCHEVKHMGRAEAVGRIRPALAHLARVNAWTPEQTQAYARHVFDQWALRSRVPWVLDISYLVEVLGP